MRRLLYGGLVMLCSCGPQELGPSQVSDAPLWSAGEGWVLGEEILRVGGLDAGEESAFDRIGAAIAENGSLILVADASRTVRIFTWDGSFRGALGGPGRGPAEFERIDALSLGLGDTLWVGDGYRSRVVGFSLEGEYLASYQIEDLPPYYGSRVVGFTGDGDPVIQGLRLVRSSAPDVEGPLSPNYLEWSRYDREARTTIKLAEGPWREEWGFRWEGHPQEGEVLFGARSHAGVGSAWLVLARRGSAFVLERVDTSGALAGSFGRPYEAESPSAEDRTAFVEEKLLVAGSDEEVERWRTFYSALPTRETYPAISDVVVDGTGASWVRHGGPPREERSTWTVFDDEGRWLGEVLLPGSLRPLEIGTDYVLGVNRGDYDVEAIVLYRLRRG